jgi:hypothetical protein
MNQLKMKTKIFLVTICCLCLTPLSRAQADPVLPPNEELFILDGEKTDFAYGRYLTPDRIAIGLSDEGVYELRGDTSIWLVEQPGSEDKLILTVRKEEETGHVLFLFALPDGTVADSFGIYDPERNEIFDKAHEPIASVDVFNNRILSPQAETLLHVFLPAVDKRLAVFFFLYHCRPMKNNVNNRIIE